MSLNSHAPDFFELWRAALLQRNQNPTILQNGSHSCYVSFINDMIQVMYEEPDTTKFRVLHLANGPAVAIEHRESDTVKVKQTLRRGDPQGNHWHLSFDVKDAVVTKAVLKPNRVEDLRFAGITRPIGNLNMGGKQ